MRPPPPSRNCSRAAIPATSEVEAGGEGEEEAALSLLLLFVGCAATTGHLLAISISSLFATGGTTSTNLSPTTIAGSHVHPEPKNASAASEQRALAAAPASLAARWTASAVARVLSCAPDRSPPLESTDCCMASKANLKKEKKSKKEKERESERREREKEKERERENGKEKKMIRIKIKTHLQSLASWRDLAMHPFSESGAVGRGGLATISEGRGDETKREGRREGVVAVAGGVVAGGATAAGAGAAEDEGGGAEVAAASTTNQTSARESKTETREART